RNHLPRESRTLSSSSTMSSFACSLTVSHLSCVARRYACQLRLVAIQRQSDSERGAPPKFRLNANCAPMALHNAVTYCQSETNTLARLFRRHKRFENAGQDVGGDAGTIIPNLDFNFLAICQQARAQPQIPASRHCVYCVADEGEQHLLHLRCVAIEPRQIGREVQVQLNAS